MMTLSPVEEKRKVTRRERWRKTHLFGVRYFQCRYCGHGIQAVGNEPPPDVCPKCYSIPQRGRKKLTYSDRWPRRRKQESPEREQ